MLRTCINIIIKTLLMLKINTVRNRPAVTAHCEVTRVYLLAYPSDLNTEITLEIKALYVSFNKILLNFNRVHIFYYFITFIIYAWQ